jgi:hypothetical protein
LKDGYHNRTVELATLPYYFVDWPLTMSLPSVFLSSLVWFFLWPPEEMLTLLFLLHCENGDFSILMKDSLPAESMVQQLWGLSSLSWTTIART